MEALAACIPGSTGVATVVEGEAYSARFKRRVGPFPLDFELDITVAERRAPEFIAVEATGKDRRLQTSVREHISVRLNDAGDGWTSVEIIAELDIAGLLASLGQNLTSMHARQVLDEFVGTVRERVESGYGLESS